MPDVSKEDREITKNIFLTEKLFLYPLFYKRKLIPTTLANAVKLLCSKTIIEHFCLYYISILVIFPDSCEKNAFVSLFFQ
jgi:hypothetical protein